MQKPNSLGAIYPIFNYFAHSRHSTFGHSRNGRARAERENSRLSLVVSSPKCKLPCRSRHNYEMMNKPENAVQWGEYAWSDQTSTTSQLVGAVDSLRYFLSLKVVP